MQSKKLNLAVEPFTLVDHLYRFGYGYNNETYRPPWLWSVFEAVRTLKNDPNYKDFEIRIGYSDEIPVPHHVSRNCDYCTDEAYRRIQRYAETYNFDVLDEFHCNCESEWKSDIQESVNFSTLDVRFERFIEAYWTAKKQILCPTA